MKKKQDPLWSCFGLSEEVPVLRMRQDSQERQEAERGAEVLVPGMRALVQPADRDAVRLQEDPAFGMGGVPAPILRFPFRQNVGPGQQKRRKRRKILACEGILRTGRVPRRGVLAGRVWLDETFVKVDAATGSRRALGTTKTDGQHKRRPRQAEEVPAVTRRVRKEGPARLAEPVLVHMERAEERIREDRKIDQNSHFRE